MPLCRLGPAAEVAAGEELPVVLGGDVRHDDDSVDYTTTINLI